MALFWLTSKSKHIHCHENSLFLNVILGGINQLLRDPEPPAFAMDLTDTEVSQGGSAMLDLKITGYPKPQVKWYVKFSIKV